MTYLNESAIFFDRQVLSERLSKSFSRTASWVCAVLDAADSRTILTTEPKLVGKSDRKGILDSKLQRPAGELISCRPVPINESLAEGLKSFSPGRLGENPDLRSYLLRFEHGIEDHVTLCPRDGVDFASMNGLLSALWPVLREDCIRDLQINKPDMCEEALLWMIANRIDVAILIMNARGQMLRANAAASQLLAHEMVLRRTRHGIRCIEDSKTREFHAALARCAASDPASSDVVVFLPSDTGQKVPLTMTRYWHENRATDLITVMMPSPPNSQRIEMLARAGGLTPAEARVASLLQSGMSNKDAANISGLKEQSVSTYAKRALSKLNVTSRAEMAQMLTWQAAGGHM